MTISLEFRYDEMTRALGSIYTPAEYASILSKWAIRKASDVVLDLGLGNGAFVFSAYDRLLELGANKESASQQIYGGEIDPVAFRELTRLAADRQIHFPNLENANFFDMRIPPVDAIVGNPPYVRRSYLGDVTALQDLLKRDTAFNAIKLSSTADLYVYFLLHSLKYLKPGGRLAVITADSWMNVLYGQALKEYFLQHLVIEKLITFDRRVFAEVQVKPVLLFGEKRSAPASPVNVDFVRVKNGIPSVEIQKYLEEETAHMDISCFRVPWNSLRAATSWGINFKAPGIYEDLASHHLMVPMADVAYTRIGLQTLAKDFFILGKNQISDLGIEEEFLAPVVQSLSHCTGPVIEPGADSSFYLFYCSHGKSQLIGTRALQYIHDGETQEVSVRGKGATVTGYHNKPRIQEARRRNWYDLRTDVERRGRAEILIPRLIYQRYATIWNRAGHVPGELFIEFIPKERYDTEVYLAILNSTLMELMLRARSQVYGGGSYNMNPGVIRSVPILYAERLSQDDKSRLVLAYRQFLSEAKNDRTGIDSAIAGVLELEASTQEKLTKSITDMRLVAASSKKSGSG